MAAQCDKVDFSLVAITVTNFPENRTIDADEEDEAGLGALQDSAVVQGYDPAYILPFCIEVKQILMPLYKLYKISPLWRLADFAVQMSLYYTVQCN